MAQSVRGSLVVTCASTSATRGSAATQLSCASFRREIFCRRLRRGTARVCCVLQPASRPQDLPLPYSTSHHPEHWDAATSEAAVGSASDDLHVVPDIWASLAAKYPNVVALQDPHKPGSPQLTFQELNEAILYFADGLRSLGLRKGECVSLLSENSYRWLVADQGVMTCGACDAVRGTRSSDMELQYIVAHSDSVGLIVESEQVLKRILPLLENEQTCPPLKFVIVLWPEEEDHAPGSCTEALEHGLAGETPPGLRCPVLGFNAVVEEGRAKAEEKGGSTGVDPSLREDDIATLVFTSGTTAEPKAVMLTHSNLMHQVRAFRKVIGLEPGNLFLSLLPPWHMYERSCEYFILGQGGRMVYSGVKTFKADLPKYPPDIFVAVPLVFEVLFNGVQNKLAAASAVQAAVATWLVAASLAFMDCLRAWRGMALPRVSASLQPEEGQAEKENMGEGYRLSPVAQAQGTLEVLWAGLMALLLLPFHLLATRLVFSKVKAAIPIGKLAISGGGSLPSHVDKFFESMGLKLLNGYGLTETSPVLSVRRDNNNILGTVGLPIDHTQIKVVDPDSNATVPDGTRGIVKGRGPQIMKGYYKDPSSTASCIDSEGWFDTGDIGWITPEVSFGPSRRCGRQLVLEGRVKDTIVLANGENVEPARVEEAVLRSPAVSQIMVIGQDQRRLSALVVGNEEELQRMILSQRAVESGAVNESVTEDEKRAVIREEIQRCLKAGGAGLNERIGSFAILEEPFSVENGLLTATMKMRRGMIYTKYQDVCQALLESRAHPRVQH